MSGAPKQTTVHLLRHGEVENPHKILYGRLPDYHLSERGRAMAELAASALANAPVGLVVSSPLERAQETAQPIADTHGLPIYTDPRIIEAGNRFEGRRFGHGEGSPTRPANWPLLVNPFRPSWGEAYTAIAARMEEAVRAAVAASRRLAGGRDVVAVSHQLPIWTLRSHFEGRHLWHDPRNRECNLASLTSFTFTGDRLTAIAYTEPAASLYPGANPVPGA